MRSQRILWALFIALALTANHSLAQQMSCGSTGADGALVVPAGEAITLDVPDSGTFNFTTIRVSGPLRFNRNSRFNPPVNFLASGDIVIDAGGGIDVSGTSGTAFDVGHGGPGGFDGGAPGIAGISAGAGHGPGSGEAGTASQPPTSGQYASGSKAYGSPLLIPLLGGSGGGGAVSSIGGGGGGGAIQLCSPTRIVVNGTLYAFEGTGSSNGSGGGIRLVAPAILGTGQVNASGGRIRIDLIDRTGLEGLQISASGLSFGSFMAPSAGPVPRLHIVHVAGNDIAPGTPSPLVFMLPFGAPASQSITVRAEGFSGTVPVSIVVTPESGNPTVINTEIDADLSPSEVTVNVDLPQNIAVRVHAWTR